MCVKAEADGVTAAHRVTSVVIDDVITDYVTDDEEADGRSCLGARRRCLTQSPACNRALTDHRRYCRESTRLLHCSALDWLVCQIHDVSE